MKNNRTRIKGGVREMSCKVNTFCGNCQISAFFETRIDDLDCALRWTFYADANVVGIEITLLEHQFNVCLGTLYRGVGFRYYQIRKDNFVFVWRTFHLEKMAVRTTLYNCHPVDPEKRQGFGEFDRMIWCVGAFLIRVPLSINENFVTNLGNGDSKSYTAAWGSQI